MFEFLPGAKPTDKGTRAKQQTLATEVREAHDEQARVEKEREDTTLLDGYGAAAVQGGVGTVDRWYRDTFEFDEPQEGYTLPEDFQEDMERNGIDRDQWALFGKARSEDHYDWLKTVALQNQDAAHVRGQFGFGTNLLFDALDPVMLGIDVMSGPLGSSAHAGRLANGLRAGLVAAVANTGVQAAAGEFDPNITDEDLLTTAAMSFGLAGALGARRGKDWKAADPAETIDGDRLKKIATESLADRENLSAMKVDGVVADPTPGVTPLHETATERSHLDRALSGANIMPAFAKARRDLAARMGKANSPLVRDAGRLLYREGVGYTDKNLAVEYSAGEISKRHLATLETEYKPLLERGWSEWRKANGYWPYSPEGRALFNEEVGRAVRGASDVSPQAKSAAAGVQRAMKRALELQQNSGIDVGDAGDNYLPRLMSEKGFRKLFGEMQLTEDEVIEKLIKPSMRKRWEVNVDPKAQAKLDEVTGHYEGASNAVRESRELADVHNSEVGHARKALDDADAEVSLLEPDDPRMKGALQRQRQAERKLDRATEKFEKSKGKLADAVKREDESKMAVGEARKVVEAGEFPEELLHAVATAYLKRAQANFEGQADKLLTKNLHSDDVDEIAEMLQEAGVSPVDMAGLLGKLRGKADDGDKLGHTKKRIDMDESFEAVLTNEAGEEVKVGMYDLFENDIDKVMGTYLRDASGWSALSQKAGIKSRAQLDAYKRQVLRDAKKAGDDVKSVERLLDIGINSTLGRSTELDPGSGASKAGRFLRSWNFARVMNQVGFSLFAELGPTIAYSGARNFLSSVLEAKSFLVRGADGTLTSKEARTMERLFAPGTDWLRHTPFLRVDDGVIVAPSITDSKFGRGVDNATTLASHVTGVMSGMAPVNTMLQRIAGRATMLRLMDMANAAKLSNAEVQRLRNWGLSQKDQDAVFAVLKGKKNIEDIDVDAVDFTTRERMASFLFRVTRHQVLEGDASDSLEMMHGVTGKLVTQFRTFMVNSYTRHFLNGVYNYQDWRTWAMATLSFGAAGMGWAGRTYLNTIGDEEARKRQLTQENFYKNAFAQSSFSTFIPMVADTVWKDLGAARAFGAEREAVFQNNRSTGLDNGILGIPTVDLAVKATQSIGMVGDMIDPNTDVTERQAENFWKIWWWNNMTGVRNLANEGIERAFPDKADGTNKD